MLWVVKDFSFYFSKLTGFSIKSVHSASDNLAVCLKTSCSSFGWLLLIQAVHGDLAECLLLTPGFCQKQLVFFGQEGLKIVKMLT